MTAPEDLPVALGTLAGVDLEEMRAAGEYRATGTGGGIYAVSYTPLSDPEGDSVGGMVVLYDITEKRQRDQQLAVLNRVLRHNLRNEMTVIRGYSESIEAAVADEELARQAGTIVEASDRLLSIGDKVRKFDAIQDRELNERPVSMAGLLDDVERGLRDEHPDAVIDRDIDAEGFDLRTDPEILETILSNLARNAIEHADGDPTVRITATGDGDRTVLEVRDRNDRIPEIETASLEAGDETQLQHGRGIGLWIVNWCVTVLNGDIRFTYEEGNVVTVLLPDSYPGSPEGSVNA